jgi:cytochrome c peroxidase
MSNGVFKNLRTVLEFYDHMAGQGNHPINPETGNAWLEPEHNATVNYEVLKDTKELTDTKVEALEAFLKLLTDAKFERLLAD